MRIARLPSCLFVAVLVIRTGLCQTDKYTDENRPYKFGFNIEGYQHRQEEKDEKGIIKGEYGFITADGYYRVTVYATDENGSFRIISMKNYYVGFPPEDPTTTPQPPSQAGRGVQLPSRGGIGGPSPNPLSADTGRNEGGSGRKGKDPVEITGLTACSDCVIPTTKKPGGGDPGQGFGGGGFGGLNGNVRAGGGGGGGSRFGGLNGNVRGSGGGGGSGFGGSNENARGGGGGGGGFDDGFGGRTPGRGGSRFPGSSSGGDRDGFTGRGRTPGGGRGGSSPNGAAGRRPEIGTVSEGLPLGVTVDDVKALLYRFNYTVGFHGHHEDGYRNGDKEGDYFFDGRDGVERRVEYIANEFGYQPNITFIDLPENDVRRPNEKTEKEFGLKGYEFKWFYKK